MEWSRGRSASWVRSGGIVALSLALVAHWEVWARWSGRGAGEVYRTDLQRRPGSFQQLGPTSAPRSRFHLKVPLRCLPTPSHRADAGLMALSATLCSTATPHRVPGHQSLKPFSFLLPPDLHLGSQSWAVWALLGPSLFLRRSCSRKTFPRLSKAFVSPAW